jgi:hypothetical protein
MSRHLQYQRLHHSHALGLRNSGSCSHSICSHALIHTRQVKLLIIVTQISGDNAREFTIANTWLLEQTSQKTITKSDVSAERGNCSLKIRANT